MVRVVELDEKWVSSGTRCIRILRVCSSTWRSESGSCRWCTWCLRFRSGGACVHGNTAWCVEATTWAVLGIGIRSVLARAWSWSRSTREARVQADRAGSSAAHPPQLRPRRNEAWRADLARSKEDLQGRGRGGGRRHGGGRHSKEPLGAEEGNDAGGWRWWRSSLPVRQVTGGAVAKRGRGGGQVGDETGHRCGPRCVAGPGG